MGVSLSSLSSSLLSVVRGQLIVARLCPSMVWREARRAQRRAGHVAVASPVDGTLVVWGGYKESHKNEYINKYRASNELIVFNPVSGQWSKRHTRGEWPPPMSGASAVIDDTNRLFLIGGFTQNNLASAEVFTLDLSTLIWSHVQVSGPKPLACDKLAVFLYDNKLYLFGGYGPGPSDPRDHVNQSGKIRDHYIHRSQRPKPDHDDLHHDVHGRAYAHDAVDDAMDDAEMLLPPWCRHELDEGQDIRLNHGWSNQLAMLDPLSGKWSWPTTSGSMPSPRAAHAMALIDDDVFLFGGRLHDRRLNDLFVLNLRTMRWRRLADNTDEHNDGRETSNNRPSGRSWHSLTPLPSNPLVDEHDQRTVKLILYGGYDTLCRPCGDCWMLVINREDRRETNVQWHRCTHLEHGPRLWHQACCSSERPETIFVIGGVVNDLLGGPWFPEHPESMLTLNVSPESLLELSMRCLLTSKSSGYQHRMIHDHHVLPKTLRKMAEARKSALLT